MRVHGNSSPVAKMKSVLHIDDHGSVYYSSVIDDKKWTYRHTYDVVRRCMIIMGPSIGVGCNTNNEK